MRLKTCTREVCTKCLQLKDNRVRKLRRFLRGAWSILYNFMLCYFVDRPRRVEFVNSVLSFHERQQLASTFPAVELTDLLPSVALSELRFENYSYRSGNVSFGELAVLAAIAKCVRPRILFEFGTYDGNTTLQLALNAPDDCVVYTIDLPPQNKVTRLRLDSGDREIIESVSPGERFREAPSAKKIVQIQSDSATYDYSSLKGKVDIVFVDASHSYEYVKNDTKHALAMLAPRGIILWHDYMVWNDVTDYLNELSKRLSLMNIKGTSLVAYRAS